MWPFKKKKPAEPITQSTFRSIICIPGTWNNWEEFILSIVKATNGEYIAAGGFLVNAKKERHYTVEFCDYDSNMKESFRYAGRATGVSEEFLNQIDSHRHVIYLSGSTGSLKEAENIAFAAEAILNAGGLGIKIETAGKAFEKNIWHDILRDFQEHNLYDMFVIDSIIDENGSVFSCGMHNLGYKETIVSGEEFQEAVDLIRIFGIYQIVDKPTILNNQTFSMTAESSRYRIIDESNQPYKEDELFGNPFGMWRLTKE